MASLVLIRHGQSQWNEKNIFTGWKDPDLTELGEKEAVEAGITLKKYGYKFDLMFTSVLLRAKRTVKLILEQIDQKDLKTIENQALNEAREKWGKDQVQAWRRSFDTPPPGGESLKNTAERVLPYFRENIMPLVKKNQEIIVVAHGNSLRALVMHLDHLSPDEVVRLEIPTGLPICYQISSQGKVQNKILLEN